MTKSFFQRPLSLTLRVTFLVAIVISVSLLLLSWIVQRSMENHFVQQDVDELRVVARAVRQSIINTNTSHINFHQSIESSISGHHGVYFLVADHNKKMLFESPGPLLSKLLDRLEPVKKITSSTLYSWKENNSTYHGVLLRYPLYHAGEIERYYVLVAASTSFHLNYLNKFKRSAWYILMVAAAITFIVSWLAVRLGHKPLRQISAGIRNINSTQLHHRLDTAKVPIELVNLVVELNKMLARVESSYIRLSYFSTDIAHELRTPLTNLMTQTQVSLNKARDVDSYREILYSNLEEYERLAMMVSDMLFLAKSDNRLLEVTLVELDLKQEILALFDYFDALVQERQIILKLISSNTKIQGDRAMLRRALSNLYSNAIRFTASGKSINTTITEFDGCARICVENPGEMIPRKHLDRLFDRFYRVDWSRKRNSDGVGLGLAITRSIIEFHQGTIKVESDEKSTRFILLLPLS